jgi:hypothetical protein
VQALEAAQANLPGYRSRCQSISSISAASSRWCLGRAAAAADTKQAYVTDKGDSKKGKKHQTG